MRRADVGFSHGTWCGTDECRHGSTVRYWRNCAACQPLSAGPLCGRIRLGDELQYRLAGCAPGSLIQGIEIFPDGSARPGDGLPVDIIRPGSRALLVGIGSNQAGIDSKGRPITTTVVDSDLRCWPPQHKVRPTLPGQHQAAPRILLMALSSLDEKSLRFSARVTFERLSTTIGGQL